MPTQRISFHFVDESPTDTAWWRRWVKELPVELREYERGGQPLARIEMGERRPLVWVAAPFPDRAQSAECRRDDELESLAAIRALTERLRGHCLETGRSVRMLRDGRGVGAILEIGPDEALAAMLDQWATISEARPADELRWWRIGYVSLWAGTVSADRYEQLLDDDEAAPDPETTVLASALGVVTYDHPHRGTNLDSAHVEERVSLRVLLAELRASRSLTAQLPANVLAREVNTVIAIYESDFSNRPADALGAGLELLGVYVYDGPNHDDDDDHFDEIEE